MANGQFGTLIDHIRRLVRAPEEGEKLDRQLLTRFVHGRDQAAFTKLVERHGPMVQGVCRRVLRNEADADDASQAAFWVLARKAATLDRRGSVAAWLYTVAYRLALRARAQAVRRQTRTQSLPGLDPPAPEQVGLRELGQVLDQELQSLPEHYRGPLVLCYLEGRPRDEAAEMLGWSLGTLKRRLEQGRTLLRSRLARRGLSLSAVLIAEQLWESPATALTPSVVQTIVEGALNFSGQVTATAPAAALAEHFLRNLTMTRFKLMATLVLAIGLAGGGAWMFRPVGASADGAPPSKDEAPAKADRPIKKEDGLALHEWGVFMASADIDMANAFMRNEWESAPAFFYGNLPSRHVPLHLVPIAKPVIFFHAPEPTELKLRVTFPKGGAPAIWWPGTIAPHETNVQFAPGMVRVDPEPGSLAWHLHLKKPFPKVKHDPDPLKTVDDKSWVKTLRDVKADQVFAWVGAEGYGLEREQFVYYDGLLPRGKWAEVIATKDKVSVRNLGERPLFDVTAIDRAANGTIRVGRLKKLEIGAEAKTLEFQMVARETWPDAGMKALTKELTDAGLNEDEALSLAKIWQHEFFETEGLNVFYRLSQEEYDRLLPLKAEPAPKETVRVGLILHPQCGAGLAQRIADLVAELGSAEFDKREKAQKQLENLGPGVALELERIHNQTTDAEVKKRLELILEKWDARKIIKP